MASEGEREPELAVALRERAPAKHREHHRSRDDSTAHETAPEPHWKASALKVGPGKPGASGQAVKASSRRRRFD